MQAESNEVDRTLSLALGIVEDAWTELRSTPYVQQRMGTRPARLPDLSFSEVERRSRVGRSLIGRLDALNVEELPHEIALTLRLVRFRADTWSREAEWYWTVVDPRGIGFYGLFLPTAYCGGALLNLLHGQLASFTFQEIEDMDRYLDLLADYARLIEQFSVRTKGQAERGIRMPREQVAQARSMLSAFKSGLRATLVVRSQRLVGFPTDDFSRKVDQLITAAIEPAFDRVLDTLSDAYLAEAPDDVGMSQYPGGAQLYRELVRFHTTLGLAAEDVHARGLARIAEIEDSMCAIRSDLGFRADGAAFIAHLDANPRWRESTVEGIAGVFLRYIDRFKPHLMNCFSITPKASYGVAPLPEALQNSMTFGYYDPPTADRPEGLYLFNSRNLKSRGLFHVAALTYHELMPGHHLHLATQQENEGLHPFRAHGFVNAYNEGWAEYAAAFLADELGLYEQPEERYGRLMFDAFLTSRLVVDTGMNALGWSLERGRNYLRAHSGLTEAEVQSESLRYSCDRPGQALAYKLGDVQLVTIRERMRHALGTGFELKKFHAAVLGPGALPLTDLEWHVEREIRKHQRAHAP